HVVPDQPYPVLDDDQRTVIEEADALAGFPTRLDDLDLQLLTGDHRWAQRLGKGIDVDHLDALYPGDPLEVLVAGEDAIVRERGQADQLVVDRRLLIDIDFDEFQLGELLAPQALQRVEAAPATHLARGVGRIGDALQLAQHEAGHGKRHRHDPGAHQLDDAPVDDHAGVEQQLLGRPRRATPEDEIGEVLLAKHD